MAQHNPAWITALRRVSVLIWKWSVPASHTDPVRIATKIGNALFPGLALRISQFVTLRQSKAPITVCESASRRWSSARKTFPAKHPFSEPPPSRIGFIALQRIPAGHAGSGPAGPTRPAVYPTPDGAQAASLQSPILRWSTKNLMHNFPSAITDS